MPNNAYHCRKRLEGFMKHKDLFEKEMVAGVQTVLEDNERMALRPAS